MRLDKYISLCTGLSRKEVKQIIKNGVLVNEEKINKADYKVDENKDEVNINNVRLRYREYVYFMLNKPKNYISATDDKKHKTVLDLLTKSDKILNPYPVGRLDIDTEGLLLITNDGELTHNLLSPKKKVAKTYYLEVSGELLEEYVEKISAGIVLEDGYKCKSAKLEILTSNLKKSSAYITIIEGKFHQVKRMMQVLGCKVTYLKRLSMGNLKLDEKLKLGEYRELTQEEIKNIKVVGGENDN